MIAAKAEVVARYQGETMLVIPLWWTTLPTSSTSFRREFSTLARSASSATVWLSI